MNIIVFSARALDGATIEVEPNETVEAVARRAARIWYENVPEKYEGGEIFGLQHIDTHHALQPWRTLAEEGVTDGSRWDHNETAGGV